MARIIKRYGNRKLYDTEASAYVSLEEIAQLVRRGETVQVLDNDTEKDLTAQTLTQIILEEGKRGKSLLPTDLLHDLVRRSNEAIDARVEQLKHGVDDLVQHSLQRVGQFLHTPKASDLEQLREQLRKLEHQLSQVLDDVEKRKPSS